MEPEARKQPDSWKAPEWKAAQKPGRHCFPFLCLFSRHLLPSCFLAIRLLCFPLFHSQRWPLELLDFHEPTGSGARKRIDSFLVAFHRLGKCLLSLSYALFWTQVRSELGGSNMAAVGATQPMSLVLGRVCSGRWGWEWDWAPVGRSVEVLWVLAIWSQSPWICGDCHYFILSTLPTFYFRNCSFSIACGPDRNHPVLVPLWFAYFSQHNVL